MSIYHGNSYNTERSVNVLILKLNSVHCLRHCIRYVSTFFCPVRAPTLSQVPSPKSEVCLSDQNVMSLSWNTNIDYSLLYAHSAFGVCSYLITSSSYDIKKMTLYERPSFATN